MPPRQNVSAESGVVSAESVDVSAESGNVAAESGVSAEHRRSPTSLRSQGMPCVLAWHHADLHKGKNKCWAALSQNGYGNRKETCEQVTDGTAPI